MGDHHAFRAGSGAGGKQDLGHVVRGQRWGIAQCRRLLILQRREMAYAISDRQRLTNQADMAKRRRLCLLDLPIHRIKSGAGYQQLNVTVLQDPRAFFTQQTGIDRHHDRANFRQPEPAKEKLRAVIQMQGDLITFANAQRVEKVCRPIDLLVKRGVAVLTHVPFAGFANQRCFTAINFGQIVPHLA